MDSLLSTINKDQREFKDKAVLMYTEAQLISAGVGIGMGGKGKFPTLYEIFPEIFKEEKEEFEKIAREKELVLHKEKMRDFANARNKK